MENLRQVSVTLENHAEIERLSIDYPSFSDSQVSSRSSMGQLSNLVEAKCSQQEDSATETQMEDSFFSENKDNPEDNEEIQTSSDDELKLGETDSGLRRRKLRRRTQHRRTLTDDSGSESDEEQNPRSRYQQQRNLPHYESDCEDVNNEIRDESCSSSSSSTDSIDSIDNINATQLEPIKLNEPSIGSQSTLSNLGTESSGQKVDSGFSDLVGRFEEDTITVDRADSADPGLEDLETGHSEEDKIIARQTDSAAEATIVLETDRSEEDDITVNRTELVSPCPEATIANPSSEFPLPDLNETSGSLKKCLSTEEANHKRTPLLRREKCEWRVDPPPLNKMTVERIKYKDDIPISVIRATRAKTKKYNLERKIFQQLLDLKQMQLRSGRANEQVFAKRLIDEFREDVLTVGLLPYNGSYCFQQLEDYLYTQLRIVQGGRTLLPLVDSNKSEDNLIGLLRDETESTLPANKCTRSTQRCPHAMYAYTTLPPACYTGVPYASLIPHNKHQNKPVRNGLNKSMENGRTILPKLNLNKNNLKKINF